MLRIIDKTGVDETVEIIKIHKNRFDIEIETGYNNSRFLTLIIGYEENERDEKILYLLGVGNEEWIRDPLELDNENIHQEIFEFVSDFVDKFFEDFSGEDKNNIHGEIMGEIENYCKNHKIKGIE